MTTKIVTKNILAGVNLNKQRTIKDHNELIIRAINELIDYIVISNENESFDNLDFKNNLMTLKKTFEILERKLLDVSL